MRCISIFGILVKIFRFLGYAETSNPDVPLTLGGTDSCSLSFSFLRVPYYSLAFLSVNVFNYGEDYNRQRNTHGLFSNSLRFNHVLILKVCTVEKIHISVVNPF